MARGGSAEEGRDLWGGVGDCQVGGAAFVEGAVVHQGGNEEGTWLLEVGAPTLEGTKKHNNNTTLSLLKTIFRRT